MTQEEYNEKTRPALRFLNKICDGDFPLMAKIATAQANMDTETLIEALKGVIEVTNGLIQDLKEL